MYKTKFYHKINTLILAVMLSLFSLTALVVSIVNQRNLREIYENNFSERVRLSNILIATLVDGEDVRHYVDLLSKKDDEFKNRQVQFYHDREELFDLQERGAPDEEQLVVLDRMKSFHLSMQDIKSDIYWSVIESLRNLRDISHTKYVYVFADTGVMLEDGRTLYTYIFDADDDNLYDEPDADGLGTVIAAEDSMITIYATKQPMETVQYEDGFYGELYFAYAPVLDSSGDVIAILGTDIDLVEMHAEIRKSMLLFTVVFLSFIVVVILMIYIFVNRYITRPLGVLTDTAQSLADGDVYTCVPDAALRQRSELGILANAVNDMSGVYQTMIKNSEELFKATKIGKLNIRADDSRYKGGIQKVIRQINDTLDSMTLYLNSIPEGIFIISKNFEMYFRNRQYVKFFGDIPASEFVRRMFEDSGEGSGPPERQFEDFLRQENNNTTIWINGLCFSITAKEISLSEMIENSVLVIAVDITDLMKEKEKAQAAARAKTDFLSRMSHEMRTPMNAIIGMAKIAGSTEDPSRLKYCLSTIGNSSKLLLDIINDVLDMSKIEAGKFTLENVPMNIKTMLTKICDIISENIKKKNQKLEVILGEDLYLDYSADELRLSQVITNLLSNAVKFTPENGSITLNVKETGSQNGAGTLRFSVSDTGIGMTAEQISRLFTSFEQADGSITRRFGGTGLGLAISKSIVEKMGGRIWVESEYGSGSTFIFEVKLERTAERKAAGEEDSNLVKKDIPDFSGVTILLAEDVDINREIFEALLSETHISIDSAENGRIAVSKFRENPEKYDLIMMDIQMPEMDGYEATRTIRAMDLPWAKSVPIIAMTANAFKEDIDHCLASGMNGHLAKPIDEAAVMEKIALYTKARGESTNDTNERE